jgi:hypothetical protein
MVRRATDHIKPCQLLSVAGCAVSMPMDQVGIDMPFSIEGRTPKINEKWEGDSTGGLFPPVISRALVFLFFAVATSTGQIREARPM